MTNLKITLINGKTYTIESDLILDIEGFAKLMGKDIVISGQDNKHYINMKYAVSVDVII